MHYAVLIIRNADNTKDINEILAPYDENLEVEPYIAMTYDEVVAHGKEYLFDHTDLKIIDINYWRDKDFYNFYYDRFLSPDEVDDDGNVLSSYNPDSKYDWYSIGGRFDILKVKKGLKSKYYSKYTDNAKKGDISWDTLTKLSKKDKDYYTKFWNYYVEEQPVPEEDKELVKEFANHYYKKSYYKEKYKTLKNYLKLMGAFSLHSVVTNDGKWHEPGRMGWFGSLESSEEENEWDASFYKTFIKDLPDDTDLTIVDCHI